MTETKRSGNPLNPFVEIPGDLAEENMETLNQETLLELVRRLDRHCNNLPSFRRLFVEESWKEWIRLRNSLYEMHEMLVTLASVGTPLQRPVAQDLLFRLDNPEKL